MGQRKPYYHQARPHQPAVLSQKPSWHHPSRSTKTQTILPAQAVLPPTAAPVGGTSQRVGPANR